jgi:hypothetical protein
MSLEMMEGQGMILNKVVPESNMKITAGKPCGPVGDNHTEINHRRFHRTASVQLTLALHQSRDLWV